MYINEDKLLNMVSKNARPLVKVKFPSSEIIFYVIAKNQNKKNCLSDFYFISSKTGMTYSYIEWYNNIGGLHSILAVGNLTKLEIVRISIHPSTHVEITDYVFIVDQPNVPYQVISVSKDRQLLNLSTFNLVTFSAGLISNQRYSLNILVEECS